MNNPAIAGFFIRQRSIGLIWHVRVFLVGMKILCNSQTDPGAIQEGYGNQGTEQTCPSVALGDFEHLANLDLIGVV